MARPRPGIDILVMPRVNPLIQRFDMDCPMKPVEIKNIYTFDRQPATRNYTVADLRVRKGSGKRLTMCNPANASEIKTCVDAGIDTLTIWADQIGMAREITPHHFAGTGINWVDRITPDDICGEVPENPKHAHTFRNLAPLHQQIYDERVSALKEFQSEVTKITSHTHRKQSQCILARRNYC